MLSSFLTSVLILGCGYSDFVYTDLREKLKQESESHIVRPGVQGEDHRRIYIYDDGSWFLTFEYFYMGDASKDISCIMAVGPDDEFSSVFEFRAKELPEADLGEPVPRPPLDPIQ
jgi:hypothetical protein